MVTIDEVQRIANLAKLEFSEEEILALTGELNRVLAYIDQLAELDVAAVEPLESLNEDIAESALRTDQAGISLPVENALQNAPKAADGYFLVPKVLGLDPGKTPPENAKAGDGDPESKDS